MVDEDTAHRLGRDCKEVGAVLLRDRLPAEKAEYSSFTTALGSSV